MKVIAGVLAVAAALTAGVAHAQSGAEVIKAKGCLNCHDFQVKKLGPAFKDIAAKHKDNKGAEAALIAKLKEGQGHPKIGATDAELKAAVGHVLATK